MNLIHVKKEPESIAGFVDPPDNVVTDEQEIAWLKIMLNQGAVNVHLPNSWLDTVQSVYELALSKNYKIMVKPIPPEPGHKASASAEFFLQVSP